MIETVFNTCSDLGIVVDNWNLYRDINQINLENAKKSSEKFDKSKKP